MSSRFDSLASGSFKLKCLIIVFLQDCDLKFLPSCPCGLQHTRFSNWGVFTQHRKQLPPCTSGDITGEGQMIILSYLDIDCNKFLLLYCYCEQTVVTSRVVVIVAGAWHVPCATCADVTSCAWSDAQWQPRQCTHSILTDKQLKTCLQNKNVSLVFILIIPISGI